VLQQLAGVDLAEIDGRLLEDQVRAGWGGGDPQDDDRCQSSKPVASLGLHAISL
jgi:hypothetical protein